ncbi:MAG: 2-amino-4-hydroxy-6-hydroxymethyldihydropteridine diphosphokinase [Saprospiraceae bacterium]|nr:2-amino-4-hydroxy-6-hydroxymethyldihydropteridine diphosphokinase [Saprospiraceae bacterium]MCB9327154.1 2-amino-4-hydroxy-6-hydroxymethyldihydropteridine diphosphokinase [Lewinellaceae bacterium]
MVYLSLGTNVGDKITNLKNAVLEISKLGTIEAISSKYESAAWDGSVQEVFYNQVVAISTSINPNQLLEDIKNIEKRLGRKETYRWGPRVIDIDILFYNGEIIDEPGLTIPHPLLHQRNFVLIPMMEIASEWMHPKLHKNIEELYELSTDSNDVYLLDEDS